MRFLFAALAAASLAACANSPKQPWGWVRVPVNKTVPPGVVLPPNAKGLPEAVVPPKAKDDTP